MAVVINGVLRLLTVLWPVLCTERDGYEPLVGHLLADDVGLSRLHAMCAADLYAGTLPISHPLLSPVAAPPSLLAKLPPLMLMVVGSPYITSNPSPCATPRIAQSSSGCTF
jgi:hypothetical protein